jgi:uncharacterized protein
MHRRFAGAPRAELQFTGGLVEPVVAEGLRLRLLGLMRLSVPEIEPLLLPRCGSIHTWWMRTPIDLVWLAMEGDHGRVLEVVAGLESGRHKQAPRADVPRRTIAALELSPGEALRLGLRPGATVSMR